MDGPSFLATMGNEMSHTEEKFPQRIIKESFFFLKTKKIRHSLRICRNLSRILSNNPKERYQENIVNKP